MPNGIKVTKADIGRKVVYRPLHGVQEEGVITSFNGRFVFVRYGNEHTPKATSPDHLSYIAEEPEGVEEFNRAWGMVF
jgi:Fe2+ or Zn2+ uptake regulation protein